MDTIALANYLFPDVTMTPEELELMDKVREAYLSRTKIGCTGCRYCMPCPNGVNIPGIFSAWNTMYTESKSEGRS